MFRTLVVIMMPAMRPLLVSEQEKLCQNFKEELQNVRC